jgi:MFS family permease
MRLWRRRHWRTEMTQSRGTARSRPAIPRTVWALGFVSLFMDISSEIIHALLPLFMTTTLGLSVALVGLIEGLAESTANITKVFSGYVSDRLGKRKPLILLGYGLGAVSKPLFPLAAGAIPVLAARFADRIGKGIRGAPRDALVADVTPPEIRGRAFGLRQSMDTVGAFLGPLLAIALMILFSSDMRAVFWVAVIPAFVAVLCVIFWVEDRPTADRPAHVPIMLAELKQLGFGYWVVVAIGVVFTLARFSEAFLILKVTAEGLPLWLAPLVLVVMNLVYAAGAYPAGILSDRSSIRALLLSGLVCLVLADIILAMSVGLAGAFAGICLWGLHMALTQGVLARLVADTTSARLRGSAFGLFNLAAGVALFVSSAAAGLIWSAFGPAMTFAAGALAAAAAAAVVLFGLHSRRSKSA